MRRASAETLVFAPLSCLTYAFAPMHDFQHQSIAGYIEGLDGALGGGLRCEVGGFEKFGRSFLVIGQGGLKDDMDIGMAMGREDLDAIEDSYF